METSTAKKTKWVIDPTHSEIFFKVKHLMITNVRGEFRKFKSEIDSIGNDFIESSIYATIETASIFTNEEKRDEHLRSADFFDVENYPQIIFEGASLRKVGNKYDELKGTLTIKGLSKVVSFDVEFGGITKDPWGNEKVGFSLSGKINRRDFGLNWNAVLETGGVMVSDEVKITAEMQFVKQA